jgi:V8-like Glu-specific endopeptidase
MNKQICNMVCPIFFGNRLNLETVEIKQVYGTAFYIGNNLFLTAGHCLSKIEEGQFLGVGYPQPPKTELGLVAFKDCETFDEYDVALVETVRDVPHIEIQKWSLDVVTSLHDVWTAGYPHALDISDMGFVAQRAFKGHTVSHIPFKRLPKGGFVDAYELSFMTPKGISGAPVFSSDSTTIVAMILGMKQTGMEVCRESEATDDGKIAEFVYYHQIMYYGVAVTAQAIAKIHSKKLGRTIGEYLRQENLIDEPLA